jgi:hypothetical protein
MNAALEKQIDDLLAHARRILLNATAVTGAKIDAIVVLAPTAQGSVVLAYAGTVSCEQAGTVEQAAPKILSGWHRMAAHGLPPEEGADAFAFDRQAARKH